MKKMLLTSAFALFGTFAMANEKTESQSELKTETVVEVFGCTYSVRTITYNSCGGFLSDVTNNYWFEGNGCEGLFMEVNRNYSGAPCGNPYEESVPGY